MPFCYSNALADPETSLRFIVISVVTLFLSAYFLLKRGYAEKSFLIGPVLISYLLLTIVCMPGLIISFNKSESLNHWLKICVLGIFFAYYLNIICEDKNYLSKLVYFVNFLILLLVIKGVHQAYDKYVYNSERNLPMIFDYTISSFAGNKNSFAEILLISLPFACLGLFQKHLFLKIICIVNLLLCLCAIFVLNSLAVWIAFISGGVLLLLIAIKTKMILRWRRKYMLAVAAICILIIAISFTKNNFELVLHKVNNIYSYLQSGKIETPLSENNSNSIYERIILWKNSIQLFRENPLLGNGLGQWKILFAQYGMGDAPYMNSGFIRFEKPHNDFLLILCEAGIPGLIFYLCFLFIPLTHGIRILNSEPASATWRLVALMLFGLFSFIVVSMFSFPFLRPFTMVLLVIIISIIEYQYYLYKKAKGGKIFASKNKLLPAFGLLFSISCLFLSVYRLHAESHLANSFRAQRKNLFERMARELNKISPVMYSMDNTGSPLYWYYGISQFNLGKTDEALFYFKKAETINPFHSVLLNDIASCYEKTGNTPEALKYYRKALDIVPLNPDALIDMSAVYYNLQKFDSAFIFISSVTPASLPSYEKNLAAILYANAYFLWDSIPGQFPRENWIRKISDTQWLKSLYLKSNRNQEQFEEELETEKTRLAEEYIKIDKSM